MTEETPTEEEHAKWKSEFELLADVTGHITISDLETFWQKDNKNPTQDDLANLVKEAGCADSDGDGKISLDEFLKLQELAKDTAFSKADNKQVLIDSLKHYDKNDDNTISKDELKEILADYDDEDLETVIAASDKNGDGQLSIEELAEFLTQTVT